MSDAKQRIEQLGAEAEGLASFPDWFPTDCPPSGSKEACEEVYRIVRAKSLVKEDFLSHHELGTALNAPPCARCGLSVYDSLANAMHRQKLSPYLGSFISKGKLISTDGKTSELKASSGHLTWWPYLDVTRPARFEEPVKCL
jgi:hypothetical protein